MNLKVLIGTILIIGLVNTQATQLEILRAWNYARANPRIVANRIKNRLRVSKVKGPKGDEKCYQEAIDNLSVRNPVPLLAEDVGLDLASWTQASDMMHNIRKLRHKGSDLSTVKQRMKRFGQFKGAYKFFEMLSFFKQTKPVPADKIIDLFITDCGNKKRPHRKIIFESDVTHFGAGVVYANKETWITVISSKGFTRNGVPNKKLDQAWIEGDGLYKGQGRSHTSARWREAGEFVHKGPQIHVQAKIDGVTDKTGPLGNLKNDKSVTCPNFVNPKILGIKVVNKWHMTSENCDRKLAPWSKSKSYVRRTLPFAQNKKCYHRLSYCLNGRVWAIDRQYKTFKEWSNKSNPDGVDELGDAKDDLSVKCPGFINPKLRKKVVRDWYATGEKCERGKRGFTDNGFFRINPFAKKNKCYQRLKYCQGGIVYLKDSQYVTYAEWRATH